jgi:hypothetical protein
VQLPQGHPAACQCRAVAASLLATRRAHHSVCKAAQYLASVNVPTELHVVIIDGLDKITVGAALMEAAHPDRFKRQVFASSEPSLSEALNANEMSSDQLFEAEVRSFLVGVMSIGS